MKKHVVAFFINPIAGMGGKVGLKGTDGMAEMARELGANAISPMRGKEAIDGLFRSVLENPEMNIELEVLTAGSPMGENICKRTLEGFEGSGGVNGRITIQRIFEPEGDVTSSEDTISFCKTARSNGAEIILFTGGDGTARDVVAGAGQDFPILGIPSGVKMHSGVFTFRPEDAGKAIMDFFMDSASLEAREVMDLDEEAYRKGEIRARLFGYAAVPVTTVLQGCKNVISTVDDGADRESIALGLEEYMKDHPGIYIMGAGSTLKDIGVHLGIELTPLGFDIVNVEDGQLRVIRKDVNEQLILKALQLAGGRERYLVITPIGAQGFILGRGTQVISGSVLAMMRVENIIVVATPGKLAITPRLRVDVGSFNDLLKGFKKVMVGYRRFVLKKVE